MQKMQINISRKVIITILSLIVIALTLISGIVMIEPGHTGVVVTLGKVEEEVMQEGIHFKIPFVQRIIQIDNKIVMLEVETEAFSKDLQTVQARLAVNYRVSTNKSYSIYKNVGSNYEYVLVTPAVNEVLKSISSTYTAEELVTNRALISEGLVEQLNGKLNESGLYITDVNIIDFDFSDAFIQAIEEKQVAQQKLLTAETEKATMIAKAEAEAQAKIIKAEAEAKANKVLTESLSSNIIEYNKIQKWDGILPQVTGSSAMISID